VHAGIIEPGHFRFSVVGEKVLRLEERLGYTHKGIEKRFEGHRPLDPDAVRLAARVSGDSTVAYGWAYAMAVESASACAVPPRAQWLRALALERERVANHLGDLGALGNDAGFAFGLAQFSRLKEDWLRLNAAALGHRYAMDYVIPGGVRDDPGHVLLQAIARQCSDIQREVARLRSIYDEHAGLQNRFHAAPQIGSTGASGAGWVEGWRGEVLVALELDPHGVIRRCHCHDSSWQNWPLLEHAVIGNIVPDFPLINKSFNLSYSGQDL
jgi:Ni,Fe-hydrogenase III large subunit